MNNVVISVVFSGSNHKIAFRETIASMLYEYIDDDCDNQQKKGFDGCGVTHGFFYGLMFGAGLDEQCQDVIETIEAEIQRGNMVTLNVYGHSRGGVAALMLAKQLSFVDPRLLNINLALLDPVPGNFITTSWLDPFEISLANKTMDLRMCKPLKKVLALYPYQPLTTVLAHAPLLAEYPASTEVEESVIPGCHSTTEFVSEEVEALSQERIFSFSDKGAIIAWLRVSTFLREAGSVFKSDLPIVCPDVGFRYEDQDLINDVYLKIYSALMSSESPSVIREAHSATNIQISAKQSGSYFNAHHQKLAGVPNDPADVRVTFEEKKQVLPNWFKKIGWGIFGVVNVVGWSILASPSVVLGMIVVAAVIGGTCAGLWDVTLKPALAWAVNRFFYSQFHFRNIQAPNMVASDSTHLLVGALGVSPLNSPVEVSYKPESQIDRSHSPMTGGMFEPLATNELSFDENDELIPRIKGC